MNPKSFADLINGRQIEKIEHTEFEIARYNNLLICFCLSDYLLCLEGANTNQYVVEDQSFIELDEYGNLFNPMAGFKKIGGLKIVWNEYGLPSWNIDTDIDHEKFTLNEKQHPFTQGIVIKLYDN